MATKCQWRNGSEAIAIPAGKSSGPVARIDAPQTVKPAASVSLLHNKAAAFCVGCYRSVIAAIAFTPWAILHLPALVGRRPGSCRNRVRSIRHNSLFFKANIAFTFSVFRRDIVLANGRQLHD
jgi:hypothetical protein